MTPLPPPPASPAGDPNEMALAAYNQNFETFRSLNGLMWQIPLIAMTLTGGLWFGVTSTEAAPEFRLGLLVLAGFGNLGLVAILQRLRYIMKCYLDWLEVANPSGHVAAPGESFFTRSQRMKQVVQALLLLAAIMSFALLYPLPFLQKHSEDAMSTAANWYDTHAEQIADGYESIEANAAHPALFEMIADKQTLTVLDIGSGTGRDAAALSALGHDVTAIDPSEKMLQLARSLHPNSDVDWRDGQLPELSSAVGEYDLILLSAVWMHVPPAERQAAFDRMVSLLAPGGTIYATLRIGPDDLERGMFAVEPGSLSIFADKAGLNLENFGERPDLLGRDGVSWQTVAISQPPQT